LANLESILAPFWKPEGEAGDDEEKRKRLLEALRAHCRYRRAQNRAIIIGIAALFLLVAAACAYDLHRRELKLTLAVGPLGIGIAPLVTILIASVSDLSKTKLTLTLAEESDAAEIRGLLEKIAGQ
jgi:hypothetical protein